MAQVSKRLSEDRDRGVRSSDLTPQRKLRRWLIAGVICSNLLTFALSIESLLHSHRHFEQRAEVLTQNVANAVDQSVSGSIERVDLALRTVADELERQLAVKGIDESAMNAFLARQLERLPEVEAFRVAQADGLVILGKGLNKRERASWADREYFVYLKDHPDGGLQISKPRIGRVAKQFIVGFARRYNYPDGRFAGVISAPIAVDHFSRLLTQFDLGANATISLRDASLGLVTRVPAIPNKPVGQVGNSDVSKELRQIVESGVTASTYFTARGADGFERILTFRKLSNAPMMILVGVAKADYLAGWYSEMHQSLAMVGAFLVSSVLLGGFLLHLLTHAERRDRELSQFKAIIESSDDGIISKTLEGIITSWNPGAERIFGYLAEEIIGKPMQTLFPADRMDEEGEILARISQGERVDHFNTQRLCKDGRLIDVAITISPIRDGRGEVIGASKIVRDITAQKQAEQELERYRYHLEELIRERTVALSIAKEAAESANRAKTTFLATMSHELLTPMSGIMGMTNMVLRRISDPKQIEQLQKVLQSSEKLLSIINDILNYSKMEAERFDLESVTFSLAEIFAEQIKHKIDQADSKGLRLVSELPPELAAQALRGDRVHLSHILDHLIDNAINFTTEGTITLRAKQEEVASTCVTVRFEVQDTGVGMSPEVQKRLFSPFEQGNGSMTRKHGGIGLGLALSKQLIKAMGGTIGVSSVEGSGSTFWFVIKLAKAD
jgi:PAS domain S-box-containing protein